MTTTNRSKYKIGDIVCWEHDSERVVTGTVFGHKEPLYQVEIHFNPGLEMDLPEAMLHPIHPDTLRDAIDTLRRASKL